MIVYNVQYVHVHTYTERSNCTCICAAESSDCLKWKCEYKHHATNRLEMVWYPPLRKYSHDCRWYGRGLYIVNQLALIHYMMKEMTDIVGCCALKHCVHNIKWKTFGSIKSSQVLKWAGTVDTIGNIISIPIRSFSRLACGWYILFVGSWLTASVIRMRWSP